MAKRLMKYFSITNHKEDGYTVVSISPDINASTWPDGYMYFNVHQKSVQWCVELMTSHGPFNEKVRLDKMTTFDIDLMKSIVMTTIERIKSKGYCVLITSDIMNEICKESVTIVKEIRENRN